MKRLTQAAGICLAVCIAGPAYAIDLTPVPAVPGAVFGPSVGGQVLGSAVYVDAAPEPLFTSVRYVDRREMHPCAVPKIIRVNNPCADKDPRNCCAPPPCVYIQICVPPCGCEDVRCRRQGDRVRYDYGKYAVDVRIKRGYIVVDYQD
ncbi:MAG: hypothetical protein GY903_28160 [Fuerstiella sp.]|nr:hypothetical protein [Fuerstiella sp.]MCP4858370.1 hypothetical protein [Fuerstiella sp.]